MGNDIFSKIRDELFFIGHSETEDPNVQIKIREDNRKFAIIFSTLQLAYWGICILFSFNDIAFRRCRNVYILAMIVCTVLGIVIERLAYKPLRQAASLAVLITAIGVSYFLQNGALLLWTSSPKVFPSVIGNGKLQLGELTISYVTLLTVAVCLVIMGALTWFTGNTKKGKAMRACSEDKGAAQLMGIDVDSTISMTFAIGSGLAAVAGVLLCSAYPTLVPTTGSMPGIKAFTAAVFGGIGSIPGAFLGGLLLGVIETFAKAYISTQLSDAVVFSVLIIVLLVRPAGLLGKTVNEKV